MHRGARLEFARNMNIVSGSTGLFNWSGSTDPDSRFTLLHNDGWDYVHLRPHNAQCVTPQSNVDMVEWWFGEPSLFEVRECWPGSSRTSIELALSTYWGTTYFPLPTCLAPWHRSRIARQCYCQTSRSGRLTISLGSLSYQDRAQIWILKKTYGNNLVVWSGKLELSSKRSASLLGDHHKEVWSGACHIWSRQS